MGKKLRNFSLISIITASMIGCGSENNDMVIQNENDIAANTIQEGHLIDGNISNVQYKCGNDLTGKTDENGTFQYKENCDLVFSIGDNFILGEIKGNKVQSDKTVTPNDLLSLPRNKTTGEYYKKYVRFLQGLDNNKNPSDGIQISEETYNILSNDSFRLDDNTTTIETLNSTLFSVGKIMPTEREALLHVEENLRTLGTEVDTVEPLTPVISNIYNNFTRDEFEMLEISGEAGTKIYVNGMYRALMEDTKSITLDTSGEDGSKNFEIKLIDSFGNESSILNVSIMKDIIYPVFTSSENIDFDENSDSNITITATDDNPLTFSLDSPTLINDNSYFKLSESGIMSFNNPPNYEEKTSYSVDLKVSDGVNITKQTLNININDLSEVIPSINETTLFVNENVAEGFVIGNLNIPDIGDSNLTNGNIVGIDSNMFVAELNSTNDGIEIKTNTGTILDYESKKSYDLEYNVSNSAGETNLKTLTINIKNVAETVPTISDLDGIINTDSEEGTVVGTVDITDSGDTDISSFTLTGDGKEDFDISLTGEITVSSIGVNKANNEIYDLTATATNGAGDSTSTVTITVNKVVPTLTGVTIDNVDTDSGEGTIVGNITIDDEGDSDITSIDLTGTDNKDFNVDTNGEITVSSNGVTKGDGETYTLGATATNSDGTSDSVTITINITSNN